MGLLDGKTALVTGAGLGMGWGNSAGGGRAKVAVRQRAEVLTS